MSDGWRSIWMLLFGLPMAVVGQAQALPWLLHQGEGAALMPPSQDAIWQYAAPAFDQIQALTTAGWGSGRLRDTLRPGWQISLTGHRLPASLREVTTFPEIAPFFLSPATARVPSVLGSDGSLLLSLLQRNPVTDAIDTAWTVPLPTGSDLQRQASLRLAGQWPITDRLLALGRVRSTLGNQAPVLRGFGAGLRFDLRPAAWCFTRRLPWHLSLLVTYDYSRWREALRSEPAPGVAPPPGLPLQPVPALGMTQHLAQMQLWLAREWKTISVWLAAGLSREENLLALTGSFWLTVLETNEFTGATRPLVRQVTNPYYRQESQWRLPYHLGLSWEPGPWGLQVQVQPWPLPSLVISGSWTRP